MDVTLNLMPKSKRLGFTLIELLVAITIIGLLSTIVTYGVVGQQRKARDAKRKSDLEMVKKAMQAAKNDCRNAAFYPRVDYSGSPQQQDGQFTDLITHLKNLGYLSTDLADPKNNGNNYQNSNHYFYGFNFDSDGPGTTNVCPEYGGAMTVNGTEEFILMAKLEVQNDPDLKTSFSKCASLTKINYVDIIESPHDAPIFGQKDGIDDLKRYFVCSD